MATFNKEPEELIRYSALMHNSVMTATSTEQWETSRLVNDVTFIVFHRVCVSFHAGSSFDTKRNNVRFYVHGQLCLEQAKVVIA
jgi:hypothetical protein